MNPFEEYYKRCIYGFHEYMIKEFCMAKTTARGLMNFASIWIC